MSVAARTVKLGVVQFASTGKAEGNLKKAFALVRDAASRGANVILLPELFLSDYFCQVENAALFDLAETIPGPTTEVASRLAAELGVVLIVPLFERRTAGLYHNSLVVIDADGAALGTYRKMHIPDDPLFYEKFYFTPGDLGYRVFETRFGKVGTLICWDQWYPEAARLTALKGAEIIVYPTAIGWHPSEKEREGAAQRDSWFTVQRSHAIANGVFVAASNRIGHEGPKGGGLQFWGTSFVADPQGIVLAKASEDREEALVVDLDLARIETVRRGWPFLRDRRVDTFGPLTERFLDG